MKYYLMLSLFLLLGCDLKSNSSNKRFDIVSSFNQVILSTDNELEAYQKVHYLNLMGKSIGSRSCYFVITNEKNNQKTQ